MPLTRRTIDLLKALPREKDENGYVFIGAKEGKPLSNMPMLELVRGMTKGKGVTVHGFRSAFRDWAAETAAHPNEVVEMALAHAVGDKTEAAYRRGDLFEKRQALMDDFASYISG